MGESQRNKIEVSTDAERRLATARAWVQSFPRDTEILVVAHSAEAGSDFQLSLLTETGASFGIKRFTLNLLAARLAQQALAMAERAPASTLSFTAVVARAIHGLQAAGKLKYFKPVATRPGFPIAVAKTLEELRLNEVAEESIARLPRVGPDLAAIAKLVDAELRAAKLSDRAVLFRTAIESLELPENVAYLQRPFLLLDVALRGTLESELVRELGARSATVLATVPEGDERTLAALEESLGCKRSKTGEENPAAAGSNSLSLVKRHLFKDSAPPRTPLDETVTLQNWPGEPRECVEIVRSIQAAAARGVPFDQVAVLLNSPGEYRAHLEEALARAEIPAYFVRGTTAPNPAGRAMLSLLSCAAEGLSARAFSEYLSLGQVPEPEAGKDVEAKWVPPEDELSVEIAAFDEDSEENSSSLVAEPEEKIVIAGALRAPARWERLLVDSAVIGGKDRWQRRLDGLANEFELRAKEAMPEDEARLASIKRQASDLESLRSYALPLISRLDALPQQATWSEWLAHLRELAVNALRRPEGVLATFAELEPMGSVGPVNLYEVRLILQARLHDLGVKPPKRRHGCVFIGPVEAARGLSFSLVFIPGLAERIFPRKIVEDPILPDRQREPIHLTTRRDQLDVERLSLRLAVGAARDRIHLSYPRIDVQQSRPRVPSFYVLEALRAAEGSLPGFEEIAARAESTTRARLGWPAPEQPESAIDEAEYDLALLASLVDEQDDQTTGRAHYLLTANQHLARALRARSRRWLRRWTPNDGLVDADELARQSLARHQFSARSFSATALQNYSNCPYRFFLSAILRLELRQEPAAIEMIDPLTRGSLFHETQYEVLTALKAEGLLPLGLDSLPAAFALIEISLHRLAAQYEDDLAPAIPRVWQDGINSIKADLREWLRRMADEADGWIPDKFELSFGLSDRGPRSSDPASVDEPVAVIGDLKLRGSIDMIERQGSDRYRVTDHKTGRAYADDRTIVGGGRYLQPLLYALASRELLAGEVESGRLYYCTSVGGYQDRVVDLNEENIQILNTVLITIRQSLADAFLPVAPDEGACRWCDFLAVCGSFEERRSHLKPRDRLVQIKAMRELP